MTTKLKRANVRRLASLSALGAGALGVAAGAAEAGTPDAEGIVYSGIVDEKVGFGGGYGSGGTIFGPGSKVGRLGLSQVRISVSSFQSHKAVIVGDYRPIFHRTFKVLCSTGMHTRHKPLIAALAQGSVFGLPPSSHSRPDGAIASSFENSRGFTQRTNVSPTDKYLLFRWVGGGLPHPVYGWAQLSVTLGGGGYPSGPDVTVVDYAYDITGAQIPAGYRGKALDGDEGEFERSGLSALSLGAAGVRSWRAARQAEATTH
jgi:hypothetical protein